MNIENYRKVLAKIEAHPEQWNQGVWHTECGTAHCFAGWAQILSGNPANDKTVRRDARIYLELTPAQADYLFSTIRSLQELRMGGGYDRNGYDRNGLDKNFQVRPDTQE